MAKNNNAVSARALRNEKARSANANKKKKKATSGAGVAKTITKAATTAKKTVESKPESYINNSRLRRNNQQAQKNNRVTAAKNDMKQTGSAVQRRAGVSDQDYNKLKKNTESVKNLTKSNLKQIVASHARTLGVASENMDVQPRNAASNIVQNKASQEVRNANKKATEAKKKDNPLSDWASKQLEKSAKEIEKQKEGMSKAGQFAADVYGAGLGLATDAMAGPLAMGSMFSRSFGSAYDSAEKEGASKGQAALYGATIGGVEAATEKLFAVAKPLQKIYGKGAADDLADRVLNKMVGKAGTQAGKDLTYHGGKTFAAALTEGLEEMIAEGLEPTIANQIYANALGDPHETDPGQILYAGAVGGAMGGLLGGGGQVVEYNQGKTVRDVFGEDGINDLLKKAVESDDAADAVKATAMKAMVDNGEGIVAGQASQLKKAVEAQVARDTERLQIASDSAANIMRDNKLLDIIENIDENGTQELSEHTKGVYEETKAQATDAIVNNSEMQLPEQTADEITSAIASIRTGAVMDIDTVNMFTLNNPEARTVYETVTGETLPKTNAETREYLYHKIAENRVGSAEAETNYFIDRLRGVLEQDIATTYDAQGQEAFAQIIGNLNPANAGQVQASIITFEDYYEAGRRGESYEFMNSLDNSVYKSLPVEIRQTAYEAGAMDQNAARTSAKGVALQLGQKGETNRSQVKSGGQRGKVTSKLSKENRSRFTAQQQIMFRKLAQVFNINIEITDDPNMNGFYHDGTITLSVEADRDLSYVFAHEITHHMELYAPEEYLRFKELVRSSWDYDGLNGAIDAKIRHYNDHGVKLTREAALDEILADSTYEMIQDENFVDELCREDRGMAQAILDALKALIKKLRAVLVDGDMFTPKQNAGLLSQLDILKDAEKLWVDGLMKAAENSDAVGVVEVDGNVQYQLNANFAAEVDSWYNDPTEFNKPGGFFKVGTTSSALQSIGVKDYDITWDKSKIKKILDDHEEMTIDVIKNVPDVIENPIIVMQSKTRMNSITLFGEVYADGIPVLVAIQLNPKSKKGKVLNFAKVASAYGKNDVQSMIDSSDILYVDQNKKRTDDWLSANGLQLPSGLTQYGSISTVTYYDPSVNNANNGPTAIQLAMQKAQQSKKFSFKDSADRELSPGQQEYFKHVSPKLKDEDGNLKRYHHGTSRGDRVGYMFDPERATSGPMAFFTDDIEIATNYSRDKRDTSLAYDSDYYSYETQFRVEIDGDDMSLIDAWHYLPAAARDKIKDRAEHTHYDWDDYETLIYDEDTVDAGGGFQWQIKEARGNIFSALCEQWLNSGTLFNDEASYLDVLEFIGVNEIFEELGYGKPYFKDPDYREEKVYEVYLNITNPFDTSDVDEEFLADLTDYIENTDMSIYDVETADADPWDKNNWDPYEWLEKLEHDIEGGTSYAWTSIPDVVTDFLKDYLEADGIVDTGGKRGGQKHQVVIPFYSEQIKDIYNENPTEDPDIRYSFKDDIDEDAVNNYVNEHPEDFPDSIPYWEYERDAARVKDQTIGELRSQVDRMKLDKKLTHGRVLDTSSVKEEVNSLVRMLMTAAEGTTAKTNLNLVNQVTENIKTMYSHLKAGNQEDAIIMSYNVAEDIVENLQLVNDEMFHTYKELRDYLRTTKVYLSEADKSNIPDFADFRRRNMGRILIVNEGNGGTSVDNMYIELCQMYPGMFDEELTHPADQLQEIAAVRESLEPYDIALNDEETLQLVKETAHDLIEIAAHGKPWGSWADRNKEAYENKVKALKQKHKEAIRDIKRKEKDRYEGNLDAQKAKADERVKKAKEKGETKLQEEKEKSKKKQFEQREARKKKELIRKMDKNIQWLSDRLLKPTDDKHLPEGYQRAIAQLLYAIDTQTARSKKLEEKYGFSQKKLKLLALKEEYHKIAENSDSGIILDEEIEGYLAELGTLLDDHTISDASAEQVEVIYKVLRNIVHGIQHINKAFNERLKENYDELANETIFVAENKKKHHDRSGIIGGLDTLLNESMITPRDFFARIGGGLNKTFLQIRKGLDDHVDNLTVTRDFFDELFAPYRKKTQIRKRNKPGSIIEDWRDSSTNEEFQLEAGGTIKLNVAQRMSLYCLMKRDQAVGHIMGSGIVASEVDAKSKIKQWAGAKKEVNSITSRVTWPDVEKIIGSLTQEQVEMADKLMGFLNNECAAWGNKASMRLFGYEKFTEENYFPIQSADVYLDSKFEGRTSVERIRNFGFTKGTVTNANNPIVIDDVFSVVADHVNKMSMYSAFAVPIADFTRVYNYKTRNEDGTLDKSVQAVLANTFGEKVDRYVNNFIADLQSNTQMRTEGFTRLVNKTLANYKKATIGMNMRVALQQPTAIIRTFILMDPKYFVNGNVNVAKNLKDMKEHCQIARWKSWGHNQVDMARDIDDIMMNREFSRFDYLSMGIYGSLDNVTWSFIWAAVRKEVQAKHPHVTVDSEEFYELCNERASEVYDRTQVVDSVLHRSQVMRNTDTMSKMLTSFMAEPTRTFNMMRGELAAAKDMFHDGDKKRATGKVAKAAIVYLMNAMFCAAAAAAADALRGKDLDDDDEPEKWFEHTLHNFIGNANPLNLLPVAKEIGSIWNGWGTQNMALEGMASFIESAKAAMDKATGDNDDPWETVLMDLGEGFGLLFGIPIKNIRREIKSIASLLGIEVSAATAEEELTEPKEKLINRAFDGMGIKDGSNIDKTLNFFGLNRTDAEKSEHERKRIVKSLDKKTKGMSTKEKQDAVWEEVMDGYTNDIEAGDVQALAERRKSLEVAGGDVAKFDKNVKSRVVSAYKKTIGTDSENTVLKDYLKTEYGYTDAKISSEIVTKSETAKEFQIALCMNDNETAAEALMYLIDAGLTYQDYQALYVNRSKAIQGGDYSTGEFTSPVTGTITSTFGYRDAPTAGASTYHKGIDIAAAEGTNVAAADGGKVSSVGYTKSKGYFVKISHGNGRYTEYLHLKGYYVQKGDAVTANQTIGLVGSTGISTGPHLHFSVIESGTYVDPAPYIGL